MWLPSILFAVMIVSHLSSAADIHGSELADLAPKELPAFVDIIFILRAYDEDDVYHQLTKAISDDLITPSMMRTINEDSLFCVDDDEDLDDFSMDELIAVAKVYPEGLLLLRVVARLRELAEADDDDARYALAYCYEFGRGVEQDMLVAFAWYTIAASHEHARAQAQLARIYLLGTELIEKNHELAVVFSGKASAQDDAAGHFLLATAYRYGAGVEHDQKIALTYFRKAAKHNHGDAYNALGTMAYLGHGMAKDTSKAFYYFMLAARVGVVTAMTNLAHLYEHGIGTSKDRVEGSYWLRLAAHYGDKYAQAKIDKLTTSKNGVRADGYFFTPSSFRPREALFKSN